MLVGCSSVSNGMHGAVTWPHRYTKIGTYVTSHFLSAIMFLHKPLVFMTVCTTAQIQTTVYIEAADVPGRNIWMMHQQLRVSMDNNISVGITCAAPDKRHNQAFADPNPHWQHNAPGLVVRETCSNLKKKKGKQILCRLAFYFFGLR